MDDRTPAAGPARLTERELAAITKRADAAESGPWEVATDMLGDGVYQTRVGGHAILRVDGYEQQNARILANAAFIAASRTDVPALLAALRAAWAENARYRAALIYLADGVADEVQPHDDSTLGQHLRNARAALAAPGAGENEETA